MGRQRVACASAIGAATAGYTLVARPWQLRWGATDQELGLSFPGDDLIPITDLTATRAISIHACADQVWPWLAQLGQGRGGFYSYDFLENLIGCDIHSAERIVPEWQHLDEGDEIKLAPEVSLEVAAVQTGRSLVLRGGIPMGSIPPPYDFTWAFVVRDAPGDTTRLFARERYAFKQSWARILVELVEVVSFAMTQKMLRTIRDQAERTVEIGQPQLGDWDILLR